MRHILFVLYFTLIFVSGVYAQSGAFLQLAQNSGSEQQLSQLPVPNQMPFGRTPPAAEKNAGDAVINKNAPDDPSAVPDDITPEQIRKYLSGTKTKNAPDVHKAKTRSTGARKSDESFIILNFDNADLKDVINTIGSITNENFILGPGIDARITIHSAKKIPVSQVMSVFESVLEANGMSLVKSGEFFKIVAGTTAKQKPLDVRKLRQAETVPDRDRPATYIIPVEFVPANEVTSILTPLLSPFGSIIPNPRNNLLIVNEISSNVRKLLDILKEVDVNVFESTRMTLFKPKYSDAETLTNELTEVLNALNLMSEGIAIIPMERINSVVIFSSSETLLKSVEGWMKRLDEHVETGQNIFVYTVQNVDAESVADILKTLYATDGSTPPKVRPKTTQTGKTTQTKRTTAPVRTTQKQPSAGGTRVEITTFEPTNSIVILAPPGIYREIVETIKRIDTYPREVLIEAIVAEVSLSDSEKLGVQWSTLHSLSLDGNDYSGLGQSSSGSTDFPSLPTTIPALASAPSGGISYVLFRPEKLIAMFNALASSSKINILSSPRLLVKDQEEASIEVGSDEPTATSTTQSSNIDTLTQNIEYRTVGIKLKIKPTISEEKTVVLDIEQEVSSVGEDKPVGGSTFPSFNTTKVKTSIIVPDQQGIILGGIIDEQVTKSKQGIPLLSSIPILGNLFRFTVDEIEKTELVIFITPHVITNQSESDMVTREFIDRLSNLKTYLLDKEKKNEIELPALEGANRAQTNEP